MYLNFNGDEFLEHYKAELDNFKRLKQFYKKYNALPLSEEKTIIGLFRLYLGLDNYNEECNALDLQRKQINQVQKEEIEEMTKAGNEMQM